MKSIGRYFCSTVLRCCGFTWRADTSREHWENVLKSVCY